MKNNITILDLRNLKKYCEDMRSEEGDIWDDEIKALENAIDALNQPKNDFKEVVDFFNDIMDTLYKELGAYDVSTESIRYARNVVYDVFSRRYKIKEMERNEKK